MLVTTLVEEKISCPLVSDLGSVPELIHPSDPWPLAGHPEARKMSCRRNCFHTSGPWPLLQGHPEGMKIIRGPRLGPTSALLGAAKARTHTSVTQEPHRHSKLLCLRARTSDS